CSRELCAGAEEAPEALREDDPRTRRESVPVHRPRARSRGREHRQRAATLAWRQGRLGKLRLVEQGGELEERKPSAARSGPQAPARSEAGARNAGEGAHPQHARDSRLGTVHSRIKGFGLTSSQGRSSRSWSCASVIQSWLI